MKRQELLFAEADIFDEQRSACGEDAVDLHPRKASGCSDHVHLFAGLSSLDDEAVAFLK